MASLTSQSGTAIINDAILGGIILEDGAYKSLPVASASFGGSEGANVYLSSSFAGHSASIIQALKESGALVAELEIL